MRFITLIFMLFSHFSALAENPIGKLLSDQALLVKAIGATKAEVVPKDVLDKAAVYIFSALNRKYDHEDFEKRFVKQLSMLWDYKVKNNRILYFNDAVFEALGLKKEHCVVQFQCSPVMAVYVPYLDLIFLQREVGDDETHRWLYHELVHAYQYAFRFPLDLELLGKISTDNWMNLEMPLAEIVDFLMLFYELQANYYTEKLFPTSEWLQAGQGDATLAGEYLIKSAFFLGTGHVSGILTGFKMWDLIADMFNKWVPSVDNTYNFSLHDKWVGISVQNIQGEQLKLHELVNLRNATLHFNPLVSYDIAWHVRLSKRTEIGYVGHNPFFQRPDGGDQKINKLLHDQFYKKVLGFNNLQVDQSLNSTSTMYSKDYNPDISKCSSALAHVIVEEPFVAWLTMPKSILKDCEIYREFVISDRERYAELFLNNSVKFYQKGTKGGPGPGLKISPADSSSKLFFRSGNGSGPALHIHPQLIIKPE